MKSGISVIPERKKFKANLGIESKQRCEMQLWGGVHWSEKGESEIEGSWILTVSERE